MNSFLAPFLSNPLWIIPEMILIWLVVTFVTSRKSGWFVLGQKFSGHEDIEGDRVRFASGSMGKGFLRVRYSNTLFLTIGKKGLYMSTLFPLRITHSPLLIPWTQIQSIETKRQLGLFKYTELKIKDHWPILQLYSNAGKKVLDAYNKYSQATDNERNNWRNK